MPENQEFRKITENVFNIESPYSEYVNFRIQYGDSDLNMNEDLFIVVRSDTLDGFKIGSLFPSPFLFQYINKKAKDYIFTDSEKSELLFNPRYNYNVILDHGRLQNIRKKFNESFYHDLKISLIHLETIQNIH